MRPATERFTYGYGKVEDLAGMAVVAGYCTICPLSQTSRCTSTLRRPPGSSTTPQLGIATTICLCTHADGKRRVARVATL